MSDKSLKLLIHELEKSAVKAALEAGKIQMRHFTRKLRVRTKPGAGLVTNVDIESERAVLRVLKKTRPDFAILAEESDSKRTNSSKPGRWIIDPLDGTTNYVHRFPMFCVSIGAEWEGEIVVGVIYHPVLQDLYVARKSGGSWLNGKRIQVSSRRRLSDCVLSTGFTTSKRISLEKEMKSFKRLSEGARAIRRPGSAALDLAYTARGVFDGFWERGLHDWDVAAGGLLVLEAGGKVTDFKANPFKTDAREILACTPHIHSRVCQSIGAKKSRSKNK